MLAKANETHMVKALFLWCPMLSFEALDVTNDKLADYEYMMTGAHAKSFLTVLGTDPEKQLAENDVHLLPGRMSIDDCKLLPKTAIFTSEFDFLRRDALAFAEKMKQTDKFLGLHDMPGATHGYEGHMKQPETIEFYKDMKKAHDAWVA